MCRVNAEAARARLQGLHFIPSSVECRTLNTCVEASTCMTPSYVVTSGRKRPPSVLWWVSSLSAHMFSGYSIELACVLCCELRGIVTDILKRSFRLLLGRAKWKKREKLQTSGGGRLGWGSPYGDREA